MAEAKDDQDPALAFPGPVALVAGPGSGKTSRLAQRIKHLVEKLAVNLTTITVITFTREAARNMKLRLTPPAEAGRPDVTLPPEQHPATICTMHSLGWRIIGENAARLKLPNECGLLPVHMRETLFEDAARLCGRDSEFGRKCADQKMKVGEPADDDQRLVFEVHRRILTACNVIDYDDQIILACQILREHEDIRKIWQQKATQLLVDEYQDINKPQLELIQLLSGTDASGLFVVGDDDQSIYGFRGAEPAYIRDFEKHFKGGRVFPIADSFRCQPHVIRAAHGFIQAFNATRIKKPEPRCSRPEGPQVAIHSIASDDKEAKMIAAMTVEALREGDVLVLAARRGYVELLKAELIRRRIAFDAPASPVSDASQIFEALRNWLDDHSNNLAFRELLQAACDSKSLGIPGPGVRTPKKVSEREEALAKVSNLWKSVFERNSLRDALLSAENDDLLDKLKAVAEDLARATGGTPKEFGQLTFDALKPWSSSERMLNELATPSAAKQRPGDGDAGLVRIMTMRNSKGLEAETVFVIGLEDGAFPAGNKGSPEFEEDARLFYVSMTRAKKALHLFHARTRSGGMTYKPKSFELKGSPFLAGLSKAHCEAKYHQSDAQRAARDKNQKKK